MEIDVVVPVMRPASVQRLIYSFSQNTVKPDQITLVSNEIESALPAYGLNLRWIRFQSQSYPFGLQDVALRRNIGIFASSCSHILTFDDDQVAPPNLIEASRKLLQTQPYFWGHHRFIDFAKYGADELIHLEPEQGRPREFPPNARHLWMSCYGGLAGFERNLMEKLGGYDLIFLGRHGGEDQNLGKRMARAVEGSERVFVFEPPFAWHPEEKTPWARPARSNVCSSGHTLVETTMNGISVQACTHCPYYWVPEQALFMDRLLMRFDPQKVDTVVEKISPGKHSGTLECFRSSGEHRA